MFKEIVIRELSNEINYESTGLVSSTVTCEQRSRPEQDETDHQRLAHVETWLSAMTHREVKHRGWSSVTILNGSIKAP